MYKHASTTTGTDMTFAVFVPDHAPGTRMPVLWYLSGLTCTHANVMEKGEYRAACAEHGVIFIAPDTSPRGEGVPDDPDAAYDFGLGAGFYVDATEEPWAKNYRMRSYIEDELPLAGAAQFRERRHDAAGDYRPFDGRAWRADDWPRAIRIAFVRCRPSRRSSHRCNARGARRR